MPRPKGSRNPPNTEAMWGKTKGSLFILPDVIPIITKEGYSWLCRCTCGNYVWIPTCKLSSGQKICSISCKSRVVASKLTTEQLQERIDTLNLNIETISCGGGGLEDTWEFICHDCSMPFTQVPRDLLSKQTSSCRCRRNLFRSKDQLLEDLVASCSEVNISFSRFISAKPNTRHKAVFSCDDCGDEFQRSIKKQLGNPRNCPRCSTSFSMRKHFYIQLVEDVGDCFLKFGISSKDPEYRRRTIEATSPFSHKIIFKTEFKDGYQAYSLEQKIKKKFGFTHPDKFCGRTECAKINDLDSILEMVREHE